MSGQQLVLTDYDVLTFTDDKPVEVHNAILNKGVHPEWQRRRRPYCDPVPPGPTVGGLGLDTALKAVARFGHVVRALAGNIQAATYHCYELVEHGRPSENSLYKSGNHDNHATLRFGSYH
ncbi:hypothetical protein PMI41_02835 [Phyllobacterium sp. YR531]|nr:hypothetical protein PMI41_02835 [Phyllobacterium sp. YR531]